MERIKFMSERTNNHGKAFKTLDEKAKSFK